MSQVYHNTDNGSCSHRVLSLVMINRSPLFTIKNEYNPRMERKKIEEDRHPLQLVLFTFTDGSIKLFPVSQHFYYS